MKVLGFGLLLAGWAITIAATVLLAGGTPRAIFILSGVGVEALGLALVIRAHIGRRSNAA